jgi:carbon storage regulator CsrA
MLVLGARIGERIFIGDTAVKVCRISSNGEIRLGFDAPSEVLIERERVRNKRLQIINHIPAGTLSRIYKP